MTLKNWPHYSHYIYYPEQRAVDQHVLVGAQLYSPRYPVQSMVLHKIKMDSHTLINVIYTVSHRPSQWLTLIQTIPQRYTKSPASRGDKFTTILIITTYFSIYISKYFFTHAVINKNVVIVYGMHGKTKLTKISMVQNSFPDFLIGLLWRWVPVISRMQGMCYQQQHFLHSEYIASTFIAAGNMFRCWRNL